MPRRAPAWIMHTEAGSGARCPGVSAAVTDPSRVPGFTRWATGARWHVKALAAHSLLAWPRAMSVCTESAVELTLEEILHRFGRDDDNDWR